MFNPGMKKIPPWKYLKPYSPEGEAFVLAALVISMVLPKNCPLTQRVAKWVLNSRLSVPRPA